MEGPRKSPGSRANAITEAIDQQVHPKYTSPQLQAEAPDFEIFGEPSALLPPGNYQVSFVGWWTGVLFNKAPKIALTFKVLNLGEHFGKTIPRWYNCKRLIGKHGKSGRFQVGRRSEFLEDYVRLVGMPSRRDRMSLSHLRPLVLLAKVDTVEVNRRQRTISEPLRYSVIREFIRIEAGA